MLLHYPLSSAVAALSMASDTLSSYYPSDLRADPAFAAVAIHLLPSAFGGTTSSPSTIASPLSSSKDTSKVQWRAHISHPLIRSVAKYIADNDSSEEMTRAHRLPITIDAQELVIRYVDVDRRSRTLHAYVYVFFS
jgi:hypothetical protein